MLLMICRNHKVPQNKLANGRKTFKEKTPNLLSNVKDQKIRAAHARPQAGAGGAPEESRRGPDGRGRDSNRDSNRDAAALALVRLRSPGSSQKRGQTHSRDHGHE